MARLFDDAQSEYLQIEQAVLSGVPLAFVCRFNINDESISHALVGICDKAEPNEYFLLMVQSSGASSTVLVAARSTGASDWAVTTSGYTENTWHHAAGIFVSATDRRAFIDGGSKGTNATDITPTGLDRLFIGMTRDNTPAIPASGMIAEVAIYDLSAWPGATDSDKADNFEKVLPSLVHYTPAAYPLGRVAYWDLIRDLNDKVGGYNLTASGTVVAAHPNIIQPCGVL